MWIRVWIREWMRAEQIAEFDGEVGMSWWGKIIGGAFGFALGGPLGAALGAAIGHQFDNGLKRAAEYDPRIGTGGFHGAERTQAAFFTAVFSVMGHLAKADGRVSEDEIATARAVMDQMQLSDEQRRVAIRLFNEGKQAGFALDEVLAQLRQEAGRQRTLMLMFVEILVHGAYADGQVHQAERALLQRVCAGVGVHAAELAQIEAMVQAQYRYAAGGGGGAHRADTSRPALSDAYDMLGVTAQSSDAEVKQAYRRLMNRHHPDKLVGKGMPEEMIKLATQKSQEIKAAYEAIRDARRA